MVLMRNLILVILFACSVSPAVAQAEFINLTARDAQLMISTQAESSDFYLLDVRTDQEYTQAHIKGSHKLDFYSADFAANVARLDRDKTYLLYCRTGVRSAKTLVLMRKLGFAKVYNMRGGIQSWYQQRMPLVFEKRSIKAE